MKNPPKTQAGITRKLGSILLWVRHRKNIPDHRLTPAQKMLDWAAASDAEEIVNKALERSMYHECLNQEWPADLVIQWPEQLPRCGGWRAKP